MSARERTRNRSVFLVVAVVAILAAAAWGIDVVGDDTAATASGGLWTWPEGTPGQADLQLSARGEESLDAVLQLAASLDQGIQADSVRRVAPIGSSARGLVLLAATGPAGVPCFAIITDDVAGGRQFSCSDASTDAASMMRFVASGGDVPYNVEWMSFVGVARSDVSRVTLLTSTGEEVELPLNVWRGFSYAAEAPQPLSKALRTYGADGKMIEEVSTVP